MKTGFWISGVSLNRTGLREVFSGISMGFDILISQLVRLLMLERNVDVVSQVPATLIVSA